MSFEGRRALADRTQETRFQGLLGQSLPADLVLSRTGGLVLRQGTILTPEALTRLQSLEAARGGQVEFKKLGVVPDAMALAVDQAREAVEYLFDNVGNVVQATRSAVATTTDTLRHLIDSGKVQCDIGAFSSHVEMIQRAMTSKDFQGGVIAIEAMRLRGEKTTIEHNVEAMLYSMMLMQYIRETRIALGNTLITNDMIFDAGISGLLHDAGKALTPHDLLNYHGRFSDVQHQQMQKHALDGYLMLSQNERIRTLVAQIAGVHHQSPDGDKGYGIGLNFREHVSHYTPLTGEAKVVSNVVKIGEIYSALTQQRPYNELWKGVIQSQSDRARCKADALMIMNQMWKSGSLGQEEYPIFYEMMASQYPLPMFRKSAVMHVDKRDLKLEPYASLGLNPEGNYVIIVKHDSNGMAVSCDILDFDIEGTYFDKRVQEDVQINFAPMLAFPPQ